MSDDELLEQACRGYLEWAVRDAEKVTGDDYERLVEMLREAGEEERKELIAGLSDGELLWIVKVNEDPSLAYAEALKIHTLALYEEVRRTFGASGNSADDDV
jgi:hypothetical protein